MDDERSRALWRQLVRAAPSAAANLEEADEASSDADFISKMKIALRETKESRKWLRFITACKLQNHDRLGSLEDEARQLAAIFATIVINVKKRLATEKAKRRQGKAKADS